MDQIQQFSILQKEETRKLTKRGGGLLYTVPLVPITGKQANNRFYTALVCPSVLPSRRTHNIMYVYNKMLSPDDLLHSW